MSNTYCKKEFRFFSVAQWKQEQAYLRAQHNRGWRFVRVRCACLYEFEACEPEDVVYQLDYNQQGAAHKAEYVQMFKDCGWEYLQEVSGYSYFRKPVSQMQGEEEIFCDDASRLEMMNRVFKGRIVPLIVCFFALIVPQLILQSQMHSPYSGLFAGFFVVLLLIYLVLFAIFSYHYYAYWRSLR